LPAPHRSHGGLHEQPDLWYDRWAGQPDDPERVPLVYYPVRLRGSSVRSLRAGDRGRGELCLALDLVSRERTRESGEGGSRDPGFLLYRGTGPVPYRLWPQEQVQTGGRPRGIPAGTFPPESETRPDAGAGRDGSGCYVCRRGAGPAEPAGSWGEIMRNEVR